MLVLIDAKARTRVSSAEEYVKMVEVCATEVNPGPVRAMSPPCHELQVTTGLAWPIRIFLP